MNHKEALIYAGGYLLRNQLAWGTSGNMSAKIAADTALITASGTNMGQLSEADFTECDIATGTVTGKKKASKELAMHLAIYKERGDIAAILHASPFYTNIFACSDTMIESKLFVESMYYLEHVAYVDYFHPGSRELAEAVQKQACNANIIIMKHHGVVVYDKTISEAIVRLETLELVCRMILQAKASGITLKKIPDKIAKDFLENSGYRPRQVFPCKKED